MITYIGGSSRLCRAPALCVGKLYKLSYNVYDTDPLLYVPFVKNGPGAEYLSPYIENWTMTTHSSAGSEFVTAQADDIYLVVEEVSYRKSYITPRHGKMEKEDFPVAYICLLSSVERDITKHIMVADVRSLVAIEDAENP
ncbi:MAG: hypothetical protein WC761_00200 [Candidatus Paceibacterota bacterium]